MLSSSVALPPAIWDRGLVYGDGVFETIAVFAGGMPLWSYHRERLGHSLARLSISADLKAIEHDLHECASRQGDALIRLVVARVAQGRGYDPRQSAQSIHTVQAFPLPVYPSAWREQGVALHLCRYRLPHNPLLAGIKHLNRLDQVVAAGEWDRRQAQEGLLMDEAGAVIEGTVSNLFILRDNTLLTPALTHCGVAGVMRAHIIDTLAASSGIAVRQTRLLVDDVLNADAAFLCNGVFGIWPVCTIGVSTLHRVPACVREWQARLDAAGYGVLYG